MSGQTIKMNYNSFISLLAVFLLSTYISIKLNWRLFSVSEAFVNIVCYEEFVRRSRKILLYDLVFGMCHWTLTHLENICVLVLHPFHRSQRNWLLCCLCWKHFGSTAAVCHFYNIFYTFNMKLVNLINSVQKYLCRFWTF